LSRGSHELSKIVSKEELMSLLARALYAVTIPVALAIPASAQREEPWELREQRAHVVDMQGKMRIMQPKDPSMAELKRRAKPVPEGTVFFMHNDRLHMVQGDRSLFETNF
jgi:hypothetical protein